MVKSCGILCRRHFSLCLRSRHHLLARSRRATSIRDETLHPGRRDVYRARSLVLRSEANTIVLTPPEPDSHLAIVDVKAADAASAVSAAWSAYRPDFKRPVKLMTPSPARDGWEERKNFDYETSPNERAVLQALCLACRRQLDGGDPRRQGTDL